MTKTLRLLAAFLCFLVFLLSTGGTAMGQCGALGDPIINIDFGTGNNLDFGGGTTTYIRNQDGQLDDGQYKVGTNISQGRVTWHNLGDHTGNGGMLIVNADYTPGIFYRIVVSGLCENTIFRFSAWIANANTLDECNGSPSPPNVRFEIRDMAGNLVDDPYETGDIMPTVTPQWQQYGFEFNTGSQTEFELVLINNNPGGCGNDLAIDDIQFSPCGPSITLMPMAFVQGDTLFYCEGDATPITIDSDIPVNNYPTPFYQWQRRNAGIAGWEDIPGETGESLTFFPLDNHWYRLSVTGSAANLANFKCRVVSDSLRASSIRLPGDDARIQHPLSTICQAADELFSPGAVALKDVGPISGYQWQHAVTGTQWQDIPGATDMEYAPDTATPGLHTFRRMAFNSCGQGFVTDVYELEIQQSIVTNLVLPQTTICADEEPILLSGGTFDSDIAGLVGEYTGTGVVNGYFYPQLAGLGVHTITFSISDTMLCSRPSVATIAVLDTVYLEPMQDRMILSGQSVVLQPATNAVQFSWSGGAGLDHYNIQNPTAAPLETTTYTLTAISDSGCSKSVDVRVVVLEELLIPNSFTPNGDGINDVWNIEGLDYYPNAHVQIFNRWGTEVFSSWGYAIPWDGQVNGSNLPAATYYYVISSDVLERPFTGSVTILR